VSTDPIKGVRARAAARVVTLLVLPLIAGCGSATALESPQTTNAPTVVTAPPATADPTARSLPQVVVVPGVRRPARVRTGVGPVAVGPPRRVPAVVRPAVTAGPPPAVALRPPVVMSRQAPATASEPNRLQSGNWSGYVAQGSFWQVGGAWTEPSVSCTAPAATVAFWVGLGGDPDFPLYQAGSGVLCQNGSPVHILWYELLTTTDRPPQVVALRISPGDAVGVTVDLRNGSTGAIRLVDSTRRWSENVKFTPEATTLSTAEWIAEATTSPSTGAVSALADFGSIAFGGCSANAGQAGLWGWPASQLSQLTLRDTSGGSAAPGAVSSGGSAAGGQFAVAYGR
jgi:Peptidase A4 family